MAVPTAITDLSITESSNSPAGSDTAASNTGPDDYLRAISAIVRREQAQATATASASTVDLGAIATGNYVHITGTTTITAFGTVAAGIERTVVFDGALTLTHNATSLILLGGASRTTAAGDVGRYRSEGSGNWREVAYHKASGYQPLDATLTALAALDSTAGLLEQTGSDTFTRTTISTFAKTLLDDTSATTARYTLGVQATPTALSTDTTLDSTYDGKFAYLDSPTLARTLTLPTAPTAGYKITLYNLNVQPWTITRGGAAVIYAFTNKGVTSFTLSQGDSVTLVYDGGNWVQSNGGSSASSGTYTPTITGKTNVASVDVSDTHHYIRVVNEVMVFGRCTLTPTASGTMEAYVTIPITSNLGPLWGSGSANGVSLAVYADTTGERAILTITAPSSAQLNFYYSFGYTVV